MNITVHVPPGRGGCYLVIGGGHIAKAAVRNPGRVVADLFRPTRHRG